MDLIYRHDVVKLVKPQGIGIELGVAEGIFHERILANSDIYFYGVDMYADHTHNTKEYKKALKRTMQYRGRSEILRMRFDEALDLFPDNYFDFIYIDGFAHNGEENGQTLTDWYPKLKQNGIFAGDDYAEEWPRVINSVDKFVTENYLSLNVINCREKVTYCQYPTWFVVKN